MTSSHRRQGGQPGNLNALKHGFYTRRLKKRDLSGIEATNLKNLTEEIALIRIFTRRMVEDSFKDPDYYDLLAVLRALCLASSTITRIIKTQSFLANDPSAYNAEIDQAIREVRLEMGLDPAPSSSESEPAFG
jgi:hypothetical protein